MAKYFWAESEDSEYYKEIDAVYGLPENPTEDELNSVAQKIMLEYGYDEPGDGIYIAKVNPITADKIAPVDLAE